MIPNGSVPEERILIVAQLRSKESDSARLIGDRIRAALRELAKLDESGPARDCLWLELWNGITTRSAAWVSPLGSSARVRVTAEDADAELIAAWEWLEANEERARHMTSGELYRTLRGVATGSHHGSARAAIADGLCGLTRVPAGTWVDLGRHDETDRLAS
jgi:hypothetical protein